MKAKVKKIEKEALKNISLTQLVDKLGELLEMKKLIEAEEKTLKAELLEKVGGEAGNYEGNNYRATVYATNTPEYDPSLVLADFPPEKLVQIIKVTSDIQKFVAPIELEKYVKNVKTTTNIRINKKEG